MLEVIRQRNISLIVCVTFFPMQKHLLSCPEEKQRCSNPNCPESIKRSELQRHVEEECSYRLQLCSLCGQSMTAAVLKVGV